MKSFMWEGSNEESSKVAVLLPGGGYTVQAPLLHWCAIMLIEQGWRVQAVEWTISEAARAEPIAFVEAALLTAFEEAPHATERLVVGKSFGSYALPWAVDNGVPGVWLTPILTYLDLREALGRADAGHLAVGGDQDDMWLPEDVAASRSELLTIVGADHALEIGTDWRACVAAQIEVHEAVDRHVRGLTSR